MRTEIVHLIADTVNFQTDFVYTHTHTQIYIYKYIYIVYMCVTILHIWLATFHLLKAMSTYMEERQRLLSTSYGPMKIWLLLYIKRGLFHTVAVSVLLYGCSTRTSKKHSEKNLDENYRRIRRVALNKSWM